MDVVSVGRPVWTSYRSDFDGRIGEVVSANIVAWFGPLEGKKIWELLFEAESERVRHLEGTGLEAPVLEVIKQWSWEAAELRLERLAERATALGERMGKPVDVEVDAGTLRLPRTYLARFWPTLFHVIRNALDHGIESSEQRLEARKPLRGRLRLQLRADEQLTLSLYGDGAGIDWGRLRAKVQALQTPVAHTADLLFADGLSSRDEVSSLSGRGVGLSDVKSSCESYGGSVEVSTEAGSGTCFRFRFPLPEAGSTLARSV